MNFHLQHSFIHYLADLHINTFVVDKHRVYLIDSWHIGLSH